MSSLSGLHLRDKAKAGVGGLKGGSSGGSGGGSGGGGGLREKAVSYRTTTSPTELSLMVKDRLDGKGEQWKYIV